MMIVEHCKCTNSHWIVYLQIIKMNLMLCDSYLNKNIFDLLEWIQEKMRGWSQWEYEKLKQVS